MLWNILLLFLCLVVIYSLLANVYYTTAQLHRKEYKGAAINFTLLVLQILILILIFILRPKEMLKSLVEFFG